MIERGKKILVTTDSWFVAPDGVSYQAVFGTIKNTFKAHTITGLVMVDTKDDQWFVEIGNITINCNQIKYAIETEECNLDNSRHWNSDVANGYKEFDTASRIYYADSYLRVI